MVEEWRTEGHQDQPRKYQPWVPLCASILIMLLVILLANSLHHTLRLLFITGTALVVILVAFVYLYARKRATR